jgi:hypothetical protein
MRRLPYFLGVSAAALVASLAAERDAAACGGCFHPPAQTLSDITDERMLLSVSPTQSTLYDQIQYSGNPTSFAWVLPIHGTVTVGLSADVLFGSIDTLTQTTINQPAGNCPSPPPECLGGGSGSGGGGFAGALAADGGTAPGVIVTQQQNVGPYETVQLHSTDPNALNNWLTQNGFSIPADVTPVIDAYQAEGFDFLAMKLLPDQGVQAMRPVRVTTSGASVTLPLRMASVGTGATVGITIWVVSDGRYEPQNFPFFHIDDNLLVWDFSTSSSNYTTLRAQNEASLGGKGWEIESSIDLNEQLITSVVESGGIYYGGGFSGAPPVDATGTYLPVGSDDGGDDGGDAGPYESADQVRSDDLAALFAGMAGPSVRVTRMRSDISHAAMTADFVLQASQDQSELSNVRNVTQYVNLQCPIYQNCNVVGSGTPQQSAASIETNGMGVGGGGCVTSSRRATTGSAVGFGALASLLAIALVRIGRSRRRG